MHHDFFVFAVIAMVVCAGLVRTSIRAKHGLPLNRRERRTAQASGGDLAAERRIELLSTENDRLISQISRLEQRLAVLERIATDPAERVSREIEALRTRD